jgi:hypothetical protein
VLLVLRHRLTYANVMATLALFIALGGTSYAALKITSKDIVNRTIKGGDVAKDSLGGTEIKESRLQTVPSAERANTASTADVSKNADHATQATTATSADSATTAQSAVAAASATNAQQLAGQAASAFERSSRTQFGKASAAPANGSAEATVLSWPDLGVALTNATNAHAGCGGGMLGVGVKNTKTTGSPTEVFERGKGPIGTVTPTNTGYFCSTTGATNFGIDLTDATGRTLFVECIVGADNQMRCLGTRSEP